MSRITHSAPALMVANIVEWANFRACSAAIEPKFNLPVRDVVTLVNGLQASPLPCDNQPTLQIGETPAQRLRRHPVRTRNQLLIWRPNDKLTINPEFRTGMEASPNPDSFRARQIMRRVPDPLSSDKTNRSRLHRDCNWQVNTVVYRVNIVCIRKVSQAA